MRDHTKLRAFQLARIFHTDSYLEIAYGSLKELDYQWSLAKRLGYLNENNLNYHEIIEEAKKVLYSLIKSVHSKK